MRELMRHCRLAFVLALFASTASAAIPQSERDALLAFFRQTNGSAWTDRSGWEGAAGTECSSWVGVSCDDSGSTVLQINLPTNNLTGTLPNELALPNLTELYLGGNQIAGTILPVTQLRKLESLVLSQNLFTGGIPAELRNLTSLKFLDLGDTVLGGSIPSALGDLTNLEELWLGGMGLIGPIPSELGRLRQLKILDLAYNQLDNEIPPQLGDLAALEVIYLHGNKLSGAIPGDLARMQNLKALYLSGNRLTDVIPTQLADMPMLEELILDSNMLSGEIPGALSKLRSLRLLHLHYNALTGRIPSDLSLLANLEELFLFNNKLEGEIPRELSQLTRLRGLDLADNDLEGRIPPELGVLTNLEQLFLGGNRLSGEIPPQLSQLGKLRVLALGDNLLVGSIPPDLGKLANLEELMLGYNQLSGPIPEALGDLSKLSVLLLENNQLSGNIPVSLTRLTGLTTLYIYTNQLSGIIPPELQRLTNLVQLLLGGNLLTGRIPPELMNLTNLNYLALNSNQLEGDIPSQLGQLTQLEYFELHDNRLSGPIPTGFGELTKLIWVNLSQNALSGPLPPLGNLKKLEYLFLGNNELSGGIPNDIGELTSLIGLSLSQNRFDGPIPAAIGKLANLQFLDLAANALRGPVPDEMLMLTKLADGQSDFCCNALNFNATRQEVRDFLTRKQYNRDWESSQTVTPANFRVSGKTATTVTLSWDRILSFDEGGYLITTIRGGVPVTIQTTPDKTFSAISIRDLEPQTAYSFTLQMVTFPNDYQKNLLVSDPSAEISETTTAAEPQPAQLVITTFPFGLVQSEGEGEDRPEDFYVVSNVGDLPTTITLTQEGNFFTQEPLNIELDGGAEEFISLRAVPQAPGAYTGFSILSSPALPPAGLRVPVYLLSVVIPTGTVIAETEQSRIDFVEPESVQIIAGSATFSNAGNAELNGILVTDVDWIIPQGNLVKIPAGQEVAVTFQINRTLREQGESPIGTLSLLYLQSSTSATHLKRPLSNGGASVSKTVITVVDTVKPNVSSSTIPPIQPPEVALLVPGVGHLREGPARFLSDVSIANAFSIQPVTDLRMFFTPEATGSASFIAPLQAVDPSTSVGVADVAKSVFNTEDQVGTLQLRTRDWDKIAVSATLRNAQNPDGSYGTELPVFRSDRAIGPGGTMFLTGLRKGPTNRTNLFLQEAAGGAVTVQIDFFNASGIQVGSLSEQLQDFRMRRIVDRVPAGAVTARLTNLAASTGRVVAYGTPYDTTTGDFWSVADWTQMFGAKRTESALIPVAGVTRGLGGRSFQTDLDIANIGTVTAIGTLRFFSHSGNSVERTVTLQPMRTLTLLNVVADFFGVVSAVGYLVYIPREGTVALSSRTYAMTSTTSGSFSTGIPTLPLDSALRLGQSQVIGGVEIASRATIHDQQPGTFRTNVGLIETSGQSATVRLTVFYADARAKIFGPLTSLNFELKPRESRLITNLHALLESFSHGSDLRNVQLQFDVVAGQGAVVTFTSSVDNGTGDSVFRIE